MCCTPSGYIIFSLRNLKSYEGRGSWAGGRGPDMRTGDRGPDNPKTLVMYFWRTKDQPFNVKPEIWYFSHTLAKLTSQNKVLTLNAKSSRDIKWTQVLVYWALLKINARNFFEKKSRNFLHDFATFATASAFKVWSFQEINRKELTRRIILYLKH